ncbi:aminoacyl-tRNA hydrolase [Candidatus Saccharibacteria bacterium]|nr:aminoacyl-tRNA hydrolase [Candidatus Saccharibacteria bacterium]
MNKQLLLVGLGNYGPEYDLTRHNIGFYCLDSFAQKLGFDGWVNKKDLKCLMTKQTIGETTVFLCKPQTYMNLSGEAVQALAQFYKIQPSDVIAVQDELDIDFGKIRLGTGGSSAGHNGIKSITKLLGTETYGRVRVGIGPKVPEQIDSADFVLQKFSSEQQADLPKLAKEVNATLSEYVYGAPRAAETRSFL